ncbi:MAG: alpha/beta hydrolase [Anaerolineae bacterium]
MTQTQVQVDLEYTYLDTNGVTLHVVQAGPKDGEPVLLLHGFPEFWYGWKAQIQALAAAGFRVWAPDQRGYNLSSKPKAVEAYRMHQLVADVIGLIDQSGHERLHLVGHDWGGAVAWSVAMRHPDRLKKLAILNIPHPAVFLETVRSNPYQMLKSWYMGFFQLPLLPEALLTGGDANGAAIMLFASSNPGTFKDQDIAEYVKAWKRPGAMTGMINWYRALFRSPSSGTPRGDVRIHVPTLMLWGEDDVALDASMAQPSIALCDEGKLITYPDAGHWIAHEKAEEVNRQLIGFFS